MRSGRSFLLLVGAGALIAPPRATGAAELSCPSSATLEALVACIRDQMPGRSSGGFVAPSAIEMEAWRSAVSAMMAGACDFALPPSLWSYARVRSFRDADSGRPYCLLMETADWNGDGVVDRGFGAFIVDAFAERELSHQVSHPIADAGTEIQAITVFKKTRSRTFLLAGAHRHAIPGDRWFFGPARTSDVAHNTATMFHTAHAAVAAHYGWKPWWAVQWHGMAEDTCEGVDVHLSHGVDTAPMAGDKILELRSHLLAHQPTWRIGVPGSRACSLNATTNVQGRLLNDGSHGAPGGWSHGSPGGWSPGGPGGWSLGGWRTGWVHDGSSAGWGLGLPAAPPARRFVHIEQHPAVRDADRWIAAVLATWP
ncbi:hypothetical protein [Sorangium sp. So ce1024]|uniref:hypothetical protein n=1 Tax=Sorangium sp. So ce1024 TaxID=3133327 RepID=UPI003EFCC4C4